MGYSKDKIKCKSLSWILQKGGSTYVLSIFYFLYIPVLLRRNNSEFFLQSPLPLMISYKIEILFYFIVINYASN